MLRLAVFGRVVAAEVLASSGLGLKEFLDAAGLGPFGGLEPLEDGIFDWFGFRHDASFEATTGCCGSVLAPRTPRRSAGRKPYIFDFFLGHPQFANGYGHEKNDLAHRTPPVSKTAARRLPNASSSRGKGLGEVDHKSYRSSANSLTRVPKTVKNIITFRARVARLGQFVTLCTPGLHRKLSDSLAPGAGGCEI